ADGPTAKWYVEPATGRLVRTVTRSGPAEMTVDLTEWKNYGGINLPSRSVVLQNGTQAAEITLTTAEVDAPVDARLFVKP
ncbi:MAG TPA: hypothetical protein VHK90_09640, partial [Thermoanaerobaculia bacterium]|nr:hypothetical protein [Thermoanaerobaculia bacterium]